MVGNCSTVVTTEVGLEFEKRIRIVQDESVDENERRRSRSLLAVAGGASAGGGSGYVLGGRRTAFRKNLSIDIGSWAHAAHGW
jgi:hypothetical protein